MIIKITDEEELPDKLKKKYNITDINKFAIIGDYKYHLDILSWCVDSGWVNGKNHNVVRIRNVQQTSNGGLFLWHNEVYKPYRSITYSILISVDYKEIKVEDTFTWIRFFNRPDDALLFKLQW